MSERHCDGCRPWLDDPDKPCPGLPDEAEALRAQLAAAQEKIVALERVNKAKARLLYAYRVGRINADKELDELIQAKAALAALDANEHQSQG